MIWWSLCVFVLASGGSALPAIVLGGERKLVLVASIKTLRCCGSCFFVSIPGLKCGCEALHACYVGAVLLSLLFQGSTAFTEQITAGKYPTYKEYQKKVNRLFPALRPPSFFFIRRERRDQDSTRVEEEEEIKRGDDEYSRQVQESFLSFGRKRVVVITLPPRRANKNI